MREEKGLCRLERGLYPGGPSHCMEPCLVILVSTREHIEIGHGHLLPNHYLHYRHRVVVSVNTVSSFAEVILY